LIYALFLSVGIFGVIRVMIEFRDRTTGTSLFPTDLSFVGNPLLASIFSAAGTAARRTTRHLDFSGFPIDFRIMFMEPRVSENEFLLSEVGDSEQSAFRVVFVPKHEINNFRYGSIFIGGAIDIEDRDGFGKFKETEAGTLSIVSINELSSCTTVHQSTSRLDFSSIRSLKLHFQFKRVVAPSVAAMTNLDGSLFSHVGRWTERNGDVGVGGVWGSKSCTTLSTVSTVSCIDKTSKRL
jgi:hypothetical protein